VLLSLLLVVGITGSAKLIERGDEIHEGALEQAIGLNEMRVLGPGQSPPSLQYATPSDSGFPRCPGVGVVIDREIQATVYLIVEGRGLLQ